MNDYLFLLICASTDCHGKSPIRERTFGPRGKSSVCTQRKRANGTTFKKGLNGWHGATPLLLKTALIGFSAVFILTFTIELVHPAGVSARMSCLYDFWGAHGEPKHRTQLQSVAFDSSQSSGSKYRITSLLAQCG